MRILQVSTSDSTGGAERVARDLHSQFAALGHTSRLAVGRKTTADEVVYGIDNSARARGGRGLRNRLRDAVGIQYRDYPGSWSLNDLADVEWDVLCFHNLHGGYFDVAALPHLSAVKPVVLVGHDMWLVTGHCAHSFDCMRWKDGCGKCPYKSTYPSVRVDFTRLNHKHKRQALAGSEFVLVAPSQWLAGVYAASHLGRRSIRVIPNPVDVETFVPGSREAARRRLGLPLDQDILLYPARAARSNAFKDIATLEAVGRRFGRGAAMTVAFSDSPTGALVNGVHEVPAVEDADVMRDYYLACDVVVYPSRAETAPLALIEAAACARPVVASRTGGCTEIVRDGETGLLVPQQDAGAMAEAVRDLLTSPDRALALGDAGRRLAEDRHDRRKVGLQWLELFAALDGTPSETIPTG